MRTPSKPASRNPFAFTPRNTLRLAVLGASLAWLEPILLGGAYAQAASVQKNYAIAPGSLGAVLGRFANEAGVVLSFQAGLTDGKQSAGLNGTYSVDQGFAALLAGSDLIATPGAQGVYVLYRAEKTSALQLGATSVVGAGIDETTENTGTYTPRQTSTATKMGLSLKETPQSVTVIPRQVMTDHHLASLDDVVKFTPGLSSNHRDSDRYTFYSRGFQIQNFEYDGIPSQTANESQQYTSTLADMAIYDRVEVVRGATGLLSGAGTPSATLNLIRKRPTSEFQGYVYGEAGAWDRYRAEADVAGPLTDSGNVRGRLVSVYQTAGSFIDAYKTEKRVMYGAVDVDLSEDTLLRFSLDYQNNDSDGVSFGHIPLFNSNGTATHFSRSFNPGAKWSYLDNTQYNFSTVLEQKLANDWTLKAAYTHQYGYRHGVVGSASAGAPDFETGGGVRMYVNRLDSYQTQDNGDLYVTGPFELGGREHELVFGANVAYTHLNYPDYERATPSVDNIYEYDGNPGGKPHLGKTGENLTRLSQNGVYGAVRLKPTDALSVILGTRVSSWTEKDDSSDDFTGESTSRDRTKKTGVVTPYAGVIYDLNDTYSVYASWTSIFLPQTFYKTASNTSLKPLEGDNYEVGLKGSFYDGALNASIALFEVKQKNTPQFVDTGEDGREVYEAISGTTTRGIETEISGEVLPGWNVIGGYTYRESHDKDDNRVETNQPMNLFKLGTTYRLPGELNKLTVGGNMTWQSDIYAVNEDFGTKAHQRPFGVVGLLANYEVDSHLSVGLNVNNLFDKKYYDGLGTFNSGSYGDPRNAVINARWKF
ncbi:TonB-dependent receptor [Pseudomonas sp. SLFW]|uniref:TonB-dependent siderophore receptor n=1 Tax=Pseudomonas sp. SLFW TaxID=2683259 RepID=UPI001412DE81|nr:TonB-dependent receptor [Pseudomonas sp. SLFW]NBB11903.1 TonB-dependent siderophore receptor [Pseudomonas sp. SLFW]